MNINIVYIREKYKNYCVINTIFVFINKNCKGHKKINYSETQYDILPKG